MTTRALGAVATLLLDPAALAHVIIKNDHHVAGGNLSSSYFPLSVAQLTHRDNDLTLT